MKGVLIGNPEELCPFPKPPKDLPASHAIRTFGPGSRQQGPEKDTGNSAAGVPSPQAGRTVGGTSPGCWGHFPGMLGPLVRTGTTNSSDQDLAPLSERIASQTPLRTHAGGRPTVTGRGSVMSPRASFVLAGPFPGPGQLQH